MAMRSSVFRYSYLIVFELTSTIILWALPSLFFTFNDSLPFLLLKRVMSLIGLSRELPPMKRNLTLSLEGRTMISMTAILRDIPPFICINVSRALETQVSPKETELKGVSKA